MGDSQVPITNDEIATLCQEPDPSTEVNNCCTYWMIFHVFLQCPLNIGILLSTNHVPDQGPEEIGAFLHRRAGHASVGETRLSRDEVYPVLPRI